MLAGLFDPNRLFAGGLLCENRLFSPDSAFHVLTIQAFCNAFAWQSVLV